MTEINLVSLDKRFDVWREPLKKKAEGVFKFLDKKNTSLDIYLVGAKKIEELNSKYRKIDKVTDVLAVEPPKGFPQIPNFLGEIYINPPYVKKKGYSMEFALIHGILHLLGFSHKGKSDKMKMEKREREILDSLI